MIPWARPKLEKNDLTHLNHAFKSNWISGGQYINKLENILKKILKAKNALVTSSGTAAIQFDIQAVVEPFWPAKIRGSSPYPHQDGSPRRKDLNLIRFDLKGAGSGGEILISPIPDLIPVAMHPFPSAGLAMEESGQKGE